MCIRDSRSRLGAWIENEWHLLACFRVIVAPVWERGLKCTDMTREAGRGRRSRLGAWIEIRQNNRLQSLPERRSRLGAWIEILLCTYLTLLFLVAPVWERGLK